MKTPHLQNPPSFRYSAPWQDAAILLDIPLIPGSRLLVTGSPDGGTYDWSIVTGDYCNAHSNDGYGSLGRAVLEGLERADSMLFL